MKQKQRWLAMLLSVLMVWTMLPTAGLPAYRVWAAKSVTFTPIYGTAGVSEEESYDKILDGKKTQDDFSKWCVEYFIGAEAVFRASEEIYVSGYTITTGNDNATAIGRNPESWTLYGCNDYESGANWETIHAVTNDTVLQNENYASYDFTFTATSNKYRYFKLEITAIEDGDVFQMAEFELQYSTCAHQWSTSGMIGPICTEPAYIVETCTVCSEVRKVPLESHPALGHDWETTETTDPTCEMDGTLKQVCKRCSTAQTIPDEGKSALGHDWKIVETLDPTCTENGQLKQVCTRCSAEQTVPDANAPAQGHQYVDNVCLFCKQPGFTLIQPSGSGSSSDPYQLSCAEHLYWLADLVNSGNNNIPYAVLTEDIVVNENLLQSLQFDENGNVLNGNQFATWTPIGTRENPLILEKIDGQGHAISGLYFNDAAAYNVGLFGHSLQGTIENLHIRDSYLNASQCVGGVCGYMVDGKMIECSFDGMINGSDTVGGLCGLAGGVDFTSCSNVGTISAFEYVGAISGSTSGIVQSCYYLEGCNGANTSLNAYGESKTAEEFKDGSVCTLLGGHPYYDENGFCVYCDTGYQQPVRNAAGQYEISSAGELYWFASQVNTQNASAKAVLTADITVNPDLLQSLQFDAEGNVTNGSDFTAWTPIGTSSRVYQGTFDGQGHTISGLYFNDKTQEFIGLFGYAQGTIQNIHVADSYFNGRDCVGGICGFIYQGGTITHCSFSGTVSGVDAVGGVVGQSTRGAVSGCSNVGTVSCPGRSSSVGGILGFILNGTVRNSYYLEGCNGAGTEFTSIEGVGTSKTAEEFRNGDVCTALGYHAYYTADGFCGYCDAYQEAVQNEAGTYEISNAGQLYWFADKVNNDNETYGSANAVLTGDITVNKGVLTADGQLAEDASKFRVWTPIGTKYDNTSTVVPYNGIFDGQGYTISGLYCNKNVKYGGLFGYLGSGTITNVSVTDMYIQTAEGHSGLCAYMQNGTISNVRLTNARLLVEENGGLGWAGLCAYAEDGTISNAHVSDTYIMVAGNSAGGICGRMEKGTISDCSSAATVAAEENWSHITLVGGICGATDSGKIVNCYSVGKLAEVNNGICSNMGEGASATNCYYLSETEESGTTCGGTAKSAAAFASGEVAYLLQDGRAATVWGQVIGTDAFPMPGSAKVYQITHYAGCNNTSPSTNSYSNLKKADTFGAHAYVNSKCKYCGMFEDGIGAKLAGYTLTLNGRIGVNFHIELDQSIANDPVTYMLFTLPDGTFRQIYVDDATTTEINGVTYHVFTVEMAVKEMTTQITAQICNGRQQGELYTFTVAEYADYILANTEKYSPETAALAQALLNYGTHAKAYFDGETLGATEEMNRVTADTLADAVPTISGEMPEGITYYGSSLLLESGTVVRHYFRVADDADVSAYGFTGNKGKYYYMDQEAVLGTVNQNCVIGGYVLSYDTMCYVRSVLASADAPDNLKQVVTALYLYNQAAIAYQQNPVS
ncbi:GLUG motif-containing protein [Ruminococcus champanellensis]|uniref:GLUG motif-containing protein n=1 Tax=Ruminococcus champanellensis TaxID=1161942 RepID=UPI0039F44955